MEFVNPRWTDASQTFVTAVVDGETIVFAADPANRHYAALVESGAEIGAALVPVIGESELIARAAELRWQREIAGIEVGGVPIATDDRSKLMILGARVAAAADPNWSTLWAGEHMIDAATMIVISDAVEAHVNAGFALFGQAKAAIVDGTLTTLEDVNAAMTA